MIDVLKRIYELRIKKGWKEYKLAKYSDLPQSTISSWYRKNMLPSLKSLDMISKAFGMTISQVMIEEDEELIPVTEDERKLLNSWEILSEEERAAIQKVIDLMLKNKALDDDDE